MAHNRARILSEAVFIDAWHDRLKVDGSTSAVHVDISFSEGRLGGDDADFPFTFRLALRRALMTIKLEPPLSIERRTIARSKPAAEAERTMILAARESAKASLTAKGRITPASIHIALGGAVQTEKEVTAEDKIKIVQAIPNIVVSPLPVDSRSYSWDMVPGYSDVLNGQPWDAAKEPRMFVKPSEPIGRIEPVISVRITCAMEDVEITDLVPKKNDLNERLRNIVHGENSMAAAIQYLKRILRDADLEPGLLDNRFADLVIADIVAVPE